MRRKREKIEKKGKEDKRRLIRNKIVMKINRGEEEEEEIVRKSEERKRMRE